MEEKEILQGLNDKPYDFVANNYYKMSKEQLKDIILEILAQFDGADYEEVKTTLVKNLKEYRSWEE